MCLELNTVRALKGNKWLLQVYQQQNEVKGYKVNSQLKAAGTPVARNIEMAKELNISFYPVFKGNACLQ